MLSPYKNVYNVDNANASNRIVDLYISLGDLLAKVSTNSWMDKDKRQWSSLRLESAPAFLGVARLDWQYIY